MDILQSILKGISSRIHSAYSTFPVYFNPVHEVQGDSFILNLLQWSVDAEPSGMDFRTYNFDIIFVPKVLQDYTYYMDANATHNSLTKGYEVIESLNRLLYIIPMEGFLSKSNDVVNIPTWGKSISVRGDVYHLFFTMEFRTKTVYDAEGTIEDYEFIAQYKE